MKKTVLYICPLLFIALSAHGASVEEKIRELAKKEEPNDYQVQLFIYNRQFAAYKYMCEVTDDEVKKLVEDRYPDDYSMQKNIYNEKVSAKEYMSNVEDSEVKGIAVRMYPNDYFMQKNSYDKQLAAKEFMKSAADAEKNPKLRTCTQMTIIRRSTLMRMNSKGGDICAKSG